MRFSGSLSLVISFSSTRLGPSATAANGCAVMKYQTILLERIGQVAKLTLNRPEVLNAINGRMFEELLAALREVTADDGSRVLVLTGAGRALCSGTDITEEKAGGERLLPHMSPLEITEYMRTGPQGVATALQRLPKPTIAMVNGLAMADGFDWALACDIRIGSVHARFRNGSLQLGLVSNSGATWLMPRALGLGKAFEFLYTDDWLDAETALQLGVLNRLVPIDQLESETLALAERIASKAPVANRLVKELVYRGLRQQFEEHLPEAAFAEALTLATDDHKEALDAFLSKRPPKFSGR